MADNQVDLVEKNIAFKIAQQFPAHYREFGSELVAMVEHYYKFVESQPNMGVYNTRRMFEYRDLGTTLESMLAFFKNKYMQDLPSVDDDASMRFILRNIMDLYRRKGTEAGLTLFFRMFYQEDIKVIYPAQYMFKPSDSDWKTGIYLQLKPNNNEFYATDGTAYSYQDLLSRNIYGSISKAKAIVDKINFVYLNGTLTPIIYLVDVKGKFIKFDTIISRFNGEDVNFGTLNGSADALEVDLDYGGTTGNKIGDIFDIESTYGKGGTAIVTELEEQFTGTIRYNLKDGGWGYTIKDTKLLTSNQVIVFRNDDLIFNELEVLTDTAGNQGTVIGQNIATVGIKMEPGNDFAINRPISTTERGADNFTLVAFDQNTGTGDIFSIAAKNDSSPGALYANTGVITDVKVEELENIESVELITDIIGDFLNVSLDSANYNTVPPALEPMSGSADPVTLATALEDAFDLTPFDLGSIKSFENINPGADYVNDTFSLVVDEQMLAFERFPQVLLLNNFTASFSVGDTITQASTGTAGLITSIDNDIGSLGVLPYSYYGFKTSSTGDFITHKGNAYDVRSVERDYSKKRFGENAIMNNSTEFSQGRIAAAEIRNSGFGYIDKEIVYLVDKEKTRHARATLRANSQGITSGFWGSLKSHINGYWTNPESKVFEYYDSGMKVQDSEYYQEYSYVIKSTVDPAKYDSVIKDTVHLAGSKLIGAFAYEAVTGPVLTSKFQLLRTDDFVVGGDPVVGPNQAVGDQTIRADNAIFTVDDTITFTVDNS